MVQNIKLLVLLGGLTALLMFVGDMIAGRTGLIFALGISGIMQVISFWNSDKIALKMNHATELSKTDYPGIFKMTEKLCQRADLPMPRLYITPERLPNAFATGRDPEHSAVALTHGLIAGLTDKELEGVIAHELGHIKNRDVFISTVAAVLASAISTLTQFAFFFRGGDSRNNPFGPFGIILAIILAPLAASIIQMTISRSREFKADWAAAEMCHSASGLASALRKLESLSRQAIQPTHLKPSMSSLYIYNPFKGDFFKSIFSTHPPIDKRIEALRNFVR